MPSSPLKTWEPRKNLLFSISKLNLRNINQWSWRQFLDIECCATNFLFNSFQIQNSLDVVSFQQEKCKSSEFCSFQNCFFSSVYNVQCAENWKLFIVYLCRHNNSVENNSSCYVKYFIVSFLVIKYLTVRLIWEKLISSFKIKKVMEVDEIKKGLASVNNHVENEDDAMIVDLAVQKDDCNYPTVIKGNDCEMKNNVDYVNNLVEDEINENKENKNIVELVANKDLTSMCVNENGTSEKETLGDLIEGSQTETKILINNIKCEPVEESNIVENKAIISTNHENLPKENHVEDGKSLEVKIKEENSVKEKAKENDSSSGHSGSEKKHDPHSRSHHSSSSSSSSRHRSKDDKHRNSSSTHKESSSHRSRDHDKLRRESSSKSRSCHHKPEEKCRCSKSHHSRHHSSSRKSKKSESVKTQCTPEEIAYELRDNSQIDWSNPYFTRVPWVPHPELSKLKYGRYYRIEVDRNGGASTVHLYYDEISHLSEAQMKECALEFIKLSYSEDENECAHYVMGIVHGAAAYLPDLVDYMADHYPTLTVKTGSLASRDNHTTTMSQYRDEVYKTYSNGTFRYAPLDQLSICGVLGEEIGAYFPDFVARLEQSPFMKPVMPWSSLSVVQTDNPRESNDGPIFWVRPGEQMLPANEALKEGARPKKRRNNELDNLAYIAGARSSEARESLFQDRTKAHADQVGVDYGISNTAPTAAVGVLKSVNCGHPEHGNRATKDVIAFHAQDYSELLEILMLDLYEPPQTQCTKWLEVSKLNTLRREGVRYAHIELHDNDVYYLPRKIIHQFQTISSVASVAWHIRLREYFKLHGAPNLHTPTGINKGQVFYEKKNVAVYYPPVCENDLLAAVTSVGSPKTPKKSEKLREYSPFKPSPRKIHKHRSLSIAKKEKLESVPQDKKEDGNEESKLGTPSKKQERSKSDEVKRTTYDESDSSKKELENGFIVKKSENSSHRRSSGDHSSSIKKERKDNQDNHAGHRKMEKSEKSEKSKSDKTPSKPKHESKHNGSSKSKSHEQKSSSSHGKHDSSHKHRDKSESSSKQKDEVNSLKRKNNDMQYYSPHKKVKEESLVESEKPNENGTCGKIVPNHEEDKNRIENSVKKDMNSSFDKCEEDTNCSKVVNNSEDSNVNNESGNSSENIHPVNFVDTQQMDVVDPVNHSIGFDLRQQIYNCGNFISGAAPPPPPPPPPPVSPPPPPPPPESPISSSPNDTLPTVPLADSNRVCSNEIPVPDSPNMEKSPVLLVGNCISESNNSQQIKKMKKKLVKKPVEKGSESYDLLGDIISQMQKKK